MRVQPLLSSKIRLYKFEQPTRHLGDAVDMGSCSGRVITRDRAEPSASPIQYNGPRQRRSRNNDGAHGFLCSQQEGDGGPGRTALRFGIRAEDLQECLQGSLGRVGRPAEDAVERIPTAAVDSPGTAVSGGTDGRVLFRGRFGASQRIRASLALTGDPGSRALRTTS